MKDDISNLLLYLTGNVFKDIKYQTSVDSGNHVLGTSSIHEGRHHMMSALRQGINEPPLYSVPRSICVHWFIHGIAPLIVIRFS